MTWGVTLVPARRGVLPLWGQSGFEPAHGDEDQAEVAAPGRGITRRCRPGGIFRARVARTLMSERIGAAG